MYKKAMLSLAILKNRLDIVLSSNVSKLNVPSFNEVKYSVSFIDKEFRYVSASRINAKVNNV